jgi:hypothetical protein
MNCPNYSERNAAGGRKISWHDRRRSLDEGILGHDQLQDDRHGLGAVASCASQDVRLDRPIHAPSDAPPTKGK